MVAVIAFMAATAGARVPYWGEAEVLFEAARIRAGYPLFVDPLVGALEYGAPPSRYLVTYPPLVSFALATVPSGLATVVGRMLATLAWFGTLAWIALTSRRECRANAIVAATFVGGTWLLANFATVARPDAFACALAGAGLVRAIRRGQLDPVSIALLALVPWVKPTMIGLPAGAFLADAVIHRTSRRIAIAAAGTGVFALALHLASAGPLFDHVLRSNAQPLALAVWLDQVPARLPFFAPLFALALIHAGRARAQPGISIGLGALVASVAWTLFALSKTGSAANYWMEPCLAAVALVAHAEGAFVFGRSGLTHAAITFVTVLYANVASIRASLEHAVAYRDDAAFVATLPTLCGLERGDVVASDEQGIELASNGRILTPAFQMGWLVRTGRLPSATWASDLELPSVRCFVAHSNDLADIPALASVVEKAFAPPVVHRDFRVFVKDRR